MEAESKAQAAPRCEEPLPEIKYLITGLMQVHIAATDLSRLTDYKRWPEFIKTIGARGLGLQIRGAMDNMLRGLVAQGIPIPMGQVKPGQLEPSPERIPDVLADDQGRGV